MSFFFFFKGINIFLVFDDFVVMKDIKGRVIEFVFLDFNVEYIGIFIWVVISSLLLLLSFFVKILLFLFYILIVKNFKEILLLNIMWVFWDL